MDFEQKCREIAGQLAGAASLCWEPKPTGVFDSDQASKFVDEAVAQLTKLKDEAVREELDWVLSHASGGGSWRRVIMQRIDHHSPQLTTLKEETDNAD